MADGNTLKVDPAEYVDEFSEQVEHWTKARPNWERKVIEGYGAQDGIRNWDAHSSTAELLDALGELLKTQDWVNVTVLAALDELRKGGSGMKVRVETFTTIQRALERYKREVEDTDLAQTTKATYILHADQFVRWLKDDFEPGGTLQRRQ